MDFKIKLISPCNLDYWVPIPHKCLPYGMCVLTACLRRNNYYVEQEDIRIKFDYQSNYLSSLLSLKRLIFADAFQKEARRIIESGNFNCWLGSVIVKLLDSLQLDRFNLIGFSIEREWQLFIALLLTRRFKQTREIPVVFGGSLVTLYVRLYPEIFNWVDYAIIGDGRVPLLKLLDHLNNNVPISEVPNLVYKNGEELKVNPRINYPLEEIPAPDFDGLPLDSYKNYRKRNNNIILPYQITRGCMNRCSFCDYEYINPEPEFKSYGKVISDLRQMEEKYKHNTFRFCDDTINNSYEYLNGLCDAFIKNRLDIYWEVFAKVGNLDRYILRKMKKAGCSLLAFGIESGSNDILNRMNKGFTAEEASQTLKYAAEAGIQNVVTFITGFPYETKEDIEKTTDFIRTNKEYIHGAAELTFFLLRGSPMYLNPQKYGLTNLRPASSGRFSFMFDESSGLKWEQKKKQQMASRKEIRGAIYKYTSFVGSDTGLRNRVVMKLTQAL